MSNSTGYWITEGEGNAALRFSRRADVRLIYFGIAGAY